MPARRNPAAPPDENIEAVRAVLYVSRETEEKLVRYAELLRLWQARINLISPNTLPELWTRHIADCAQFVPLAPPDAKTWADIGSGAGLPGLVIAILLHDRPGMRMHLIESNGKKAAFLRTAARETGAPAIIHDGRIEDVLPKLSGIEVVTARALASLNDLVTMTALTLEHGAIGLFAKGQGVEEELTVARRSWTIAADFMPSRTDPQGRIVVVRSARPSQG